MNPTSLPVVSIVIPTYRRADDLTQLLDSLYELDYPIDRIQIIVVDNGSDTATRQLLDDKWPLAILLTPGKNLFSNGARQLGLQQATGKYVFFLDDDNTLKQDCLNILIDTLEQDDQLGFVGPVMLYGTTDTIWSAGAHMSSFATPRYLLVGKKYPLEVDADMFIKDIDYFPNACLARKEALDKAPLDAVNFPHNWAESDSCLRILAQGYTSACVLAAVDRHHIGYTGALTRVKPETIYDQARSRISFRKRHYNRPSDWLKFWCVIFPVSTAAYALAILRSKQGKISMTKSYFRGTYDGAQRPLEDFEP